MILRVEGGGVTLVDLDDLTSLSAHILGDATIGDRGRLEDGHLWVSTQTLLELAGARAGDQRWRGRFDGMIDYARQHGWVDGDEVRMHVVGE
ncbi:hypothetical protein ACQEVZ_00460 [Dactylosporangium sp. CA-152071]|uniref:hypothetical protein n=1 Tax=Dactylosporangium sp. CA-152071 TaxID=3239933 RepID=UPI003D94F05A